MILATGTGAQTAFATVVVGLPVLAPSIRRALDLTLPQVGVMLAGFAAGGLATGFAWGLAADRFGERRTLSIGVAAMGAFLLAATVVSGFAELAALVVLAGAAGASVASGSARAVMHWFAPDERGFALGIRQTAIPIGGLAAAVVLPIVEDVAGLRAAFATLAAVCFAGAGAGALLLRENPATPARTASGSARRPAAWRLLDRRLFRLGGAVGFYFFTQTTIVGFLVLFLHDARGLSVATGALVLAAVNVLGGALRIATGRWSDRSRRRFVPLRHYGIATSVAVTLLVVLTGAPIVVLVPVVILAGGISMGWNGLAITAAAELGGRDRSGSAIGLNMSFVSASGIVAPVVFATAVAVTSWRAAFLLLALSALLGSWLLKPLADDETGTSEPTRATGSESAWSIPSAALPADDA